METWARWDASLPAKIRSLCRLRPGTTMDLVSWDSSKQAPQAATVGLQALSEGLSKESHGWVQQPLYEAALRDHVASAPRECELTAHYGHAASIAADARTFLPLRHPCLAGWSVVDATETDGEWSVVLERTTRGDRHYAEAGLDGSVTDAGDDAAAPKASGRERRTVLARVLVGCDGGRSSTRRHLPGADLCGQGGLGASLTVVFRRCG